MRHAFKKLAHLLRYSGDNTLGVIDTVHFLEHVVVDKLYKVIPRIGLIKHFAPTIPSI